MKRKTWISLLMILLLVAAAGCGAKQDPSKEESKKEETGVLTTETTTAEESKTQESTTEISQTEPASEKNGEVVILFTSDVHCGIDQGFGYAGLSQIRESLEAQGYETILVDDGDSIQGETIGTLSKGEAIIDLMNALKYDVAIPGNHEYDYGTERFLELVQKADFPYISCNFTKEGKLVLPSYVIKEAAGLKIGFVGVTTPQTITSSTPAYFQNAQGEFVYGFMQDANGEAVYQAVQKAVDEARAEGADYVYVLGHLGLGEDAAPWTYADVISHTHGIDVFLDGHSHDTEQVVMKNENGEDVIRSAVGTKLSGIGYSYLSAEGIGETNLWTWNNSVSAPELLGLDNEMSAAVAKATEELTETLNQRVATSEVTLTISDPEEKDSAGKPIRMIRRAETNLGNFCADAILAASGADVALMNGGGIRTDLEKGEVTYGDIVNVFPFGNELCVIEATGQQIADALEWGAKAVPGEFGGFLQPAGLSYEIDVSVPSGCTSDENQMMTGISGERRVKNILVGGEPIDLKKTYTVAGMNYTLLNHGDGHTAFDGANVLQKGSALDNQLLIDYIVNTLGGTIGEQYADPYGEGRITIVGE